MKEDFDKGSTVYLANVKRWIDSNGTVTLTVRRSDRKGMVKLDGKNTFA